ncbi:MAG: DUF4350 domain-containing protein [Bacteroidota bacterium]
MNVLYVSILSLFLGSHLLAQQVADTSYQPPILQPAYDPGLGPLVFIDEGHHNFHTKEGRYKAFANLLERDGYQVESYTGEFELETLSRGKILVISNALNVRNVQDWYLPTPSAFHPAEISVLEQWVKAGGSLFLIADHMPLAGAAADLAEAFGYTFTNGFVFDTVSNGPGIFHRQDSSLRSNKITNGCNSSEKIEKIATFTGQAFQIPEQAESILVFGEQYVNLLPDTAWVFTERTRRLPAQDWHQGAYQQYSKGKLAVFGEAAMFSAQLAGPQQRKAGMNNPIAPENFQLLLNIIHWLDDIL